MTIFQSTFTQQGFSAYPGQLYDSGSKKQVSAKAARGLVKAGYGVFKVAGVGGRGTNIVDPGEVFHIPSPTAAANTTAIITSGASSASIQTLSGASLTGAVGGSEMQPARQITLILSNHANWLSTNAVLTGVNHLGQTVSENLAIPAGGNVTVTSTNRYRRVTSLVIPVQGGTSGTFTVGIAALASITIADFRGVAMRQVVKVTPNSSALFGYPDLTSTAVPADYIDTEMVPVLTRGGIWVFTETAVNDMDDVYVRIASGAGGSTLGAFRNDSDSASCVQVTNARFVYDCAAGVAPAYFNIAG